MIRLLIVGVVLATGLLSCSNRSQRQPTVITDEEADKGNVLAATSDCHDISDTLLIDFSNQIPLKASPEFARMVSEIQKAGRYKAVRHEYGAALESSSKDFYIEYDTCDNAHFYRKKIEIKNIAVAYAHFLSKSTDKHLGDQYSSFSMEEWKFEDTAARDSIYTVVDKVYNGKNEVDYVYKSPIEMIKSGNSIYVIRVHTPHERSYLTKHKAFIDKVLMEQ